MYHQIVLVTVFFFASANSQSVGWLNADWAAKGRYNIRFLEVYLESNHPDTETDPFGNTLLMTAASNNNIAAINLLLANGSDVNKQINGGWTALVRAALTGRTEALRTLLRAPRIDVNIQSVQGDTALGLAGSDAVARLLRRKGAVCRCGSSFCRIGGYSNC